MFSRFLGADTCTQISILDLQSRNRQLDQMSWNGYSPALQVYVGSPALHLVISIIQALEFLKPRSHRTGGGTRLLLVL